MSNSDLNFLSAGEMAEKVRGRELSPVELVRAHLARIEKVNPTINAFVQVDGERALDEAREAEARVMRGDPLGPVHGVPISVKSSVEVAGLNCEAGTKLRQGYVAGDDAPLVRRLRAAGAIVLGVTNTPELLMAWETDNRLYGRTNNPWDISRTAGGSSGGEAAAIASGCSAGGVGSDAGGSIRVPAHFCGICGLKPTPGRIPATGHYPPSVGPFALLGVVGPMARTVGDLKVLFEVMQGPDLGDPAAAPVPVRWPSFLATGGNAHRTTNHTGGAQDASRRPRIAFFEEDGRTAVTPETRIAVRTAAGRLREAGFEVEAFRPDGLEKARELWWKFFGVAGGMVLGPLTEGHEDELSSILKQFQSWVAAESPLTTQSLLDCWMERDRIRMQVFEQMERYPVLLSPVAAIPAFRHGERTWQIEGRTVAYLDAWSYCAWFNLLGTPAVVVPMAHSAEGLPIGIQIVTRPWEEELALAVAQVLEPARGAWLPPRTG